MTTAAHYFYGLGRRKCAIAQVRLYPNGNGAVIVNGNVLNRAKLDAMLAAVAEAVAHN